MQELEVFGAQVRAVLAQVIDLFVRNANSGQLSDLLLQPVVGLSVEFEVGGTVGESVSNLCVDHQYVSLRCTDRKAGIPILGKYFKTAHCIVSL